MAQKTIPALNPITSITKDALFPVDSGIETFKMTSQNVAKELARIFPISERNYLDNPGFDVWQRKTSDTTAAGRNYICDRWYTKNSLGTNGVITTSRQTGNVAGSRFALKQVISTAPTASQANGCELHQVIENPESVLLMGKDASFSVYVRAFGNVNQIGLQFMYETSEGPLATVIGSEVTATVSTGSDTLVKIEGQNLGTSMTSAGVIGVRIRITGVSTGNTYDLANGFQVEQAMLNLGLTAMPFKKPTLEEIEDRCLRFFEKSYAPGTDPGTVTNLGALVFVRGDGSNALDVRFQKNKRIAPTVVAYSAATGTTGKVYEPKAGIDRNANVNNGSEKGFICDPSSATVGYSYLVHYRADSEI
jgi:hypothetical protein